MQRLANDKSLEGWKSGVYCHTFSRLYTDEEGVRCTLRKGFGIMEGRSAGARMPFASFPHQLTFRLSKGHLMRSPLIST